MINFKRMVCHDYRAKNYRKALKAQSLLLPECAEDYAAYRKKRLAYIGYRIMYSPLYIPLIFIACIFHPLRYLCSALEIIGSLLNSKIYPLSLGNEVSNLASQVEHGDYNRARKMRDIHGWRYPSYHYANKRDDDG